MRKLGLATGAHVDTTDYDRYLQLFSNGLSEEQTRHIDDLFSAFPTANWGTEEKGMRAVVDA
jgi:hypothetical protein